jgi:hypothetical protein
MSENHEVQIAILKTELDHVRKDMDEVKADVRVIKETLQEAKGGWKTLMLVAGISSTVGAMIAKFAPWFGVLPK